MNSRPEQSRSSELSKKTGDVQSRHSAGSRQEFSFPGKLTRLQQSVGNQGLLKMLQTGRLQAKLTVSHPDDMYEKEADRVADQVMRMPEPGLQLKPG